MVALKRHITRLFVLLLLLGGTINEAWGATVTYHILTLPINPEVYNYHMKSSITGYRLEAFKVVEENQSNVELPAHYKSPLAKDFTYYKPEDISGHGGSAVSLYDNGPNKGVLYKVKGVDTDDPKPTAVAEGTTIEGNSAEYYVVYSYDESNTIAKLDGLVRYNIEIKNKGFLSLNRGRNNRPAIVPKAKVDPEMLTSEDFSYVKNPGNGIGTYWDSGDNKNKREDTESKFFFMFKFEGKDPYHIVVRTAYAKDSTYIEKNDGTSNFVYKWYKEASLFAAGTANCYIASDEHKLYNLSYNINTYPVNPTNLTQGEGTGYIVKNGNYHGQTNVIWGTVALLNNTNNKGYVFMGTRTVDNNGAVPGPANNNKYYYLKFTGNNLNYAQITSAEATKDHTIEGFYPITEVNFHVTTPFYDNDGTPEEKAAHTLTASVQMSKYTMATASISDDGIPTSLKRKYCNINGYYKDAAHSNPITSYNDLGAGSDIYLGYDVLSDIPFKTVAPADTTWYELTDEGSIQATGKKIKYDVNGDPYKYFQNNGAADVYEKTSEFAFIGDPYELYVISRSQTWAAGTGNVSYVGVTGDTPSSGTALTASTTATAGYKWQIPVDGTSNTDKNFPLQLYKGEGHWSWEANHISEAVTYGTNKTIDITNGNAQTITLNISGLTYVEGHYIKVTVSGTDAAQVVSTTPALTDGKGAVQSDGTATVTVTIASSGGATKEFIVTITEYNGSNNAVINTATDVTINQAATAYAGGDVTYSTSGKTRLKVMELPVRTYTYKIVDKAGNIAAKASVNQTIFSPLSLASIPSIIISPFLVGETLTFYNNDYTDKAGRNTLTSEIKETPNISDDIFVKYTTAHLHEKPIQLSEDQEIFVKLNGKYIYYDKNTKTIKSSLDSQDAAAYKWLLRGRDPYAMLIDNLGARAGQNPEVTGREEVNIYDDNGGVTTPTRDKGAWVKLNGDLPDTGESTALTFDTNRANAQRFIAKSSGTIGDPIYEVMVADGNRDAGGETPEYYNIGCPSDETRIYKNTTYAHSKDVLKFELEVNTVITYHLIDKSKADLVQVRSRSMDLFLPTVYRSPLVSTYHYWQASAFVDANPEGGTDFNFTGSPVEVTSIGQLTDAKYNTPIASNATNWGNAASAGKQMTATTEDNMIAQVKLIQGTGTYEFRIGSDPSYTYMAVTITAGHKDNADIYVTYDTDEHFVFGTTNPITLKFLNGKSYKLEDGNDKLTKTKMQAMYPYCNGDGNLNIYGEESNKEQMDGGSSTRPRWIWFMESDSRDPYHVKIHSRSTISFNGDNSTYLQTYAVHFKQDGDNDTKHIVTGGNLSGISQISPTEYMILGETKDKKTTYKLLTTNPVEGERRYVTSFEQYWKTYNMLKQHVLGIDVKNDENYKDEFSENPATFVIPDELRDDLVEKLSVFQETATAASDYNTKKAALNSIGVYYFRIGESESYTYNKVTVTAVPPQEYTYTEVTNGDFATLWENALDINRSTELNYVSGSVWHSYDAVANAQRWNGFDDKGKASKKVEELEHWFQSFDMGDGTFEIESADIPPVLVLLDRQGWEIMRKTLPTGPDPEKIATLKAYDSPLVKEYHFYSNATKATGCHKYTLRLNDKKELRDVIKENGKPFVSTSLGMLPTLKADKYGTYSDVYVTYTVKEEYEKSYKYSLTNLNKEDGTYTETGTPSKFLIVINARYARNNIPGDNQPSYFSKPVSQGMSPTGGNVYDMILNPSHESIGNVIVDAKGGGVGGNEPDGKIDDNNLWYIQPNLDIDEEMGIKWGTSNDTTSAEPLSKFGNKVKYEKKTGFDPYNIQLKNVETSEFFTMNLGSTELEGGAWKGTLALDGITLDAQTTSGYVSAEGYDHTTLQITNQTFMAVSDANGNMQLMPRFDHTKRVNIATKAHYLTTLQDPKDHKEADVKDNASMGEQTAFFVRPQVFDYRIIDNDGNEALRYKSAGEYSPAVPSKFISPLATDFKYYYGNTTNVITADADATLWESAEELYKRTALTEALVTSQANLLPATGDYYFRIGTNPNSYSYKKVSVSKVKEITDMFADVENVDYDDTPVYVRYSYNRSADDSDNDILQGKWFTINLAGKDVQADGTLVTKDDSETTEVVEIPGTGVSLYADEATPTKPNSVTSDDADRKWQWKFLAAPTDISSPYYRPVDPYAVQIFNRSANYALTLDEPNPMSIGIKVSDGGETPNYYDRFVLLSHPNGGYALAVAGLETYSYSFLNGAKMTTPSSTAASIVEEIYQKTVNNSGYDALKAELTEGDDAVYYIKSKGTEATDQPEYHKVTVASHAISEDITCTAEEWEKAYISPGARLILNDDVEHNYQYNVITNGSKLAIRGTQDNAGAERNRFIPYLPEDMQSRLLNDDDYIYYGSATITDAATPTPSDPYDDTYTMVDATKLITLHGLYDDVVYVRYNAYDMDSTKYDVPNKKAVVEGKVAKDPTSLDVALNINDGLPYNIFWENHNMMRSTDNTNIIAESSTSQNLSGYASDTWQFAGNDPYALKIKHKNGNYVYNSSGNVCTLDNKNATLFMLLKNDDYDYGILQKTSDASANKLTFGDHDSDGGTTAETLYLSTNDPKYFIIFGLSTGKLLYHLVINSSNKSTSIPYREGTENTWKEKQDKEESWTWTTGDVDEIPGTTQRDLISMRYGIPGDKYQLGSTIMGQTYSVDAGEVSIGDVLNVPDEFNRPNCNFFFYIDNILSSGAPATYQKGASSDITSEEAMRTSADALEATGDYYYKITGGKIYRKVHVTSVSPSVVYEVSGSTKAAYDAATSTLFQRTADSFEAMKSDAASITILGDHYYKINDGASYYRFTKYPIAVNDGADTTIVVCTKSDYDNAVAYKQATVVSEAAMETAANSLASVGDYYYEIGPLALYKKVHVTTAKVAETPAVYSVVDCTKDEWDNVWQDNTTLNNKYKGLKLPVQSPRLMSDAGLIGCLVKVNVAYAFQTGLETNAGEGFVTSVGQNLWYTFETFDKKNDKSYLAHYTNAWGLQAMEGRETHYTNDYLWTPLGDVYGFKMYNRYMIKNSGGVNNVMTMPSISEGQNLMLHLPDAEYTVGNEIFELMLSNTQGSFRIHPVINDTGTKYYIRKDPSDNYAKLSTTATEWTFGLGSELLKPYIERVGYVGGLTESAYTAHKTDLDKVKDGTANYTDLLNVQKIVYDDDNIVKYAPGCYRLHSQPDVSGMNTVRYASGYLHSVEKGSGPSTAIPLHFYSRIGTNTTFEGLESGFKVTDATRGPIPIPATEYDPSTIFYFDGAAVNTPYANPTSKMSTQGLYVAANPNGDSDNGTKTSKLQRAVMSGDSNDAINFTLMDIGGAVLLIHDGADPADRKYLNFDQSNFFQRTVENSTDYDTEKVKLPSIGDYYFKIGSSTYKKVSVTALDTYAYSEGDANETDWTRAADLYDLKYYHDSPTDDAKWCMEPANNQGLLVETHSGGDGYYYATFCAPYDLKLPINVVKEEVIEKDYYAYICTEWNAQTIHPIKTGGGGKEIPAGTPVIIRTSDTSGSVKLTIPSTPLSFAAVADNVFTGKYLEQLLSTPITSEDMVYAFGLPITGYGIVTTSGDTNGDITNTIAKSQDYTGVGFYINATPNKELSEETGLWAPNNRYVLHNKIYYRSSESSGASAPQMDNAPDFVPVIFGDEEPGEEELQPDGSVQVVGDGCIYDLLGRKVATKEQVEDGTWRERLAPGIYILNGKKFKK